MQDILDRIGEYILKKTGYTLGLELKEEFEGDFEYLLKQEFQKGYKQAIKDMEE